MDWVAQIPYARFAINTSVHASTSQTPFYMIHFNDPILPHQLIAGERPIYSDRPGSETLKRLVKAYKETEEHNVIAFHRQKLAFDKHSQVKQLKIGQRVYLNTSGDAK